MDFIRKIKGELIHSGTYITSDLHKAESQLSNFNVEVPVTGCMYVLMRSTLLSMSRFLGNQVEISVMTTDWWKPLVSWWRFTEIHFLTEIYISHTGILAESIPFSHLFCGRHKGHLWQTKWQQTTISIISCCGLPESTLSFFFLSYPLQWCYMLCWFYCPSVTLSVYNF